VRRCSFTLLLKQTNLLAFLGVCPSFNQPHLPSQE
jgi:hypothetical protein